MNRTGLLPSAAILRNPRRVSIVVSMFFLLTGLAIAAVRADEAVAPKVHPDSTNWQDLFAPDLSNAIYPKGVWFVENGELTASEDQFIWTKKEYENFVIDLEFKNNAEGTNSGVMVYCTDLDHPYSHVVEVQVLDDYAKKWAGIPKKWQWRGYLRSPSAEEADGREEGRPVEPNDRYLPGAAALPLC